MRIDSMNGMNVLITGGLGFIGSNLAHKLIGLGANVTIYDALLPGYGGNWANIEEIRNGVEVVTGDIRNYDELKSHVGNVDIIYHCAAQVSRVVSVSDPWCDTEINCIGILNLLEAGRRCMKKDLKVIYTSSRAVIGLPMYLPADENAPTRPVDIYGINKLAGEMYCKVYQRIYGLKIAILRLNNCYGPRAQLKTSTYGVLNWWIGRAMEDKSLPVFAPGTQLRDYNYVEDVTDAIVVASQRGEAIGETFCLGSGKPIQLLDLANLIVRIACKGKVEMTTFPTEWSSIETGDFYATYARIHEKLGWAPKTDMEVGVRETVKFYVNRLSEYLESAR